MHWTSSGNVYHLFGSKPLKFIASDQVLAACATFRAAQSCQNSGGASDAPHAPGAPAMYADCRVQPIRVLHATKYRSA
jgi:hypothetical protein